MVFQENMFLKKLRQNLENDRKLLRLRIYFELDRWNFLSDPDFYSRELVHRQKPSLDRVK